MVGPGEPASSVSLVQHVARAPAQGAWGAVPALVSAACMMHWQCINGVWLCTRMHNELA